MKNLLNYYYHIILNDSDLSHGYFSYDNHHFLLYEYERGLEEVEALLFTNNEMLNSGLSINRIVLNINHEPLTYFEGKYYTLILILIEDKLISFKPSLAFIHEKNNILKRNNWSYLWNSKIDYIEYQMQHLENRYPLIRDSVNYFIGLAENASSYFNMLNLENVPLYYNHRRINKDNFYNPMEIVIDYKVRDISEYLKYEFIMEKMSISEIKKIILQLNLTYLDYLLLYVRMLYPSFYFDLYEKIINNNVDEKEILKIIDKVPLYEELLYEIYYVMKKKYNLLGIDWINKKFIL